MTYVLVILSLTGGVDRTRVLDSWEACKAQERPYKGGQFPGELRTCYRVPNSARNIELGREHLRYPLPPADRKHFLADDPGLPYPDGYIR